MPCASAIGDHSSAAAPIRIPTQVAPSMLAILPVITCTPFLDLPLARLARGHAGIHACDVTSGLCQATSRRVGITIDPIENLDTAARGTAAGPLIASRELQRGPRFGLGIEAVNVHVHGVVGDGQDAIARRAYRRIRAVPAAIRLPHELRLHRV